jgi:hypothetical protein
MKNKDLLIFDLGARINTGVILSCCDMVGEELTSIDKNGLVNNDYDIEEVKPFLFPFEAMSEELFETLKEGCQYSYMNGRTGFQLLRITSFTRQALKILIDNHFDINDLIPQGLALDARKYKVYES